MSTQNPESGQGADSRSLNRWGETPITTVDTASLRSLVRPPGEPKPVVSAANAVVVPVEPPPFKTWDMIHEHRRGECEVISDEEPMPPSIGRSESIGVIWESNAPCEICSDEPLPPPAKG